VQVLLSEAAPVTTVDLDVPGGRALVLREQPLAQRLIALFSDPLAVGLIERGAVPVSVASTFLARCPPAPPWFGRPDHPWFLRAGLP
jgi:hypothetical protein